MHNPYHLYMVVIHRIIRYLKGILRVFNSLVYNIFYFNETLSPVIKLVTIRLILTLALSKHWVTSAR
uniref:Retrovirus-related Pol polyprotein from transposon TNT 1-94 n=1 Tax=Cajanus cajan TaxID=3821 RepID=A0A151TZI7_CAJCA|nr:hypothetical protein KK1_005024 [Cajanus cajan]